MLTASVNLIDGRLTDLRNGQHLMLEELLSLRTEVQSVQSGVQGIHNQLLAMQDTQFREDFTRLQETYCEVLRRLGMQNTPNIG